MGNYISCALSSHALRHSGGAKVVLPGGEIRQFNQVMNAAELMFENPNYFLVNSQSLQIGRRFSAISADEDLETGNVYVMFPMRRANSVITPEDMGALLVTADSAVRRATGGKARVLPADEGPPAEEEKVGLDEIADDELIIELKARRSMCRLRRPLLDTIAEETVL